jgi:hypothetical protein
MTVLIMINFYGLKVRRKETTWKTKDSLMMEAARTSETSVDKYFTRQYIPEDKSELQKVTKF